MDTNRSISWQNKVILFLAFTAMGLLTYSVFSPLDPMMSKHYDLAGRIVMITVLLGVSLWMRQSENLRPYWLVVFGMFVMITAVSVDWWVGSYWIDSGTINPSTPRGYALQKISEFVIIYTVIISLTRISGGSLGSLYLQKGKLKLGLLIGFGTFILAALFSIPMANVLFKGNGLTLQRIITWAPWILIFVLANAAQEELLFRGLFLRKLEPFFGKFVSNFMVALVFVALHGVATYASDRYLFLAVTFPFALLWGYVMQKSDGIWGSILFHAGMDIPIMLGILSNL